MSSYNSSQVRKVEAANSRTTNPQTANPTDGKKRANGQNRESRFWKSRLEISDAVFSPPWQSLMNYALVGVGIILVAPFIFQLAWVLVTKRFDSKAWADRNFDLSYLSSIHIVRSMFEPWGIGLGMFCSFAFFAIALCMSKKWRLAADGWLLSIFERFCRECLTGDMNKNLRLLMFVACMTVAPFLAWHAPLAWWEAAAGSYRACINACHDAAEPQDQELCLKVGMHEVSHLMRDDQPEKSDVAEKCFKLFKELHNSTYIATMIKEHKSFLTFEAILRQVYAVSILDIYGCLLGAVICVVVVSAKIALRQKARMLATLKFQYIRNHMVRTQSELQTYRDLFKGVCKWQEQEEQFSWSLKLLGHMDDKLSKAQTQGPVSERIEDKVSERIERDEACKQAFDECCKHDVTDDDEPACSDVAEDSRVAFLTLVFALVDTMIPWSTRWWRTFGKQPFAADDQFRPVVLFNALVTFVSDFSTFAFLLAAYSRHKGMLQKVIAFDCLWRFPEEDPLHTVTRDTELLITKVEQGEWQGYQGADFTVDTAKLKERQKQLGHWFHLRQYIQLEGVDERVSMEVATTVALLMLVPRFTIFAVNLLVMDSHFWTEQAVNLQLVWATFCTLGVTIQSLTVTLNLNDLFERHLHRLELLLEDTKLKRTLDPKDEGDVAVDEGDGAVAMDLESDPVVCTVQTILDVLKKSDVPSTMFGISVNRKMIAGYVALTAASCVPQGVVILRNFLNEVTSSM